MKEKYLILFFLCLNLTCKAQIIHGEVLDESTKKPIPFANVYFNGTLKGTSTDSLGLFYLKYLENQKLPLSISYIGYYSKNISNYNSKKELKILLKQKTFELTAVELKTKKTKNKRKQKERIFKKEFLGQSFRSNGCSIKNIKDIELTFSKDKKTLFAFANKPIIITNTYLGYEIEYYLNKFYYKRDTVFIQGTYFFSEPKIRDIAILAKIKKHRKSAYLGSRMHFIRALYNNKLKTEGFSVLGSNRFKYNYDSIISPNNANYIKVRKYIQVSYKGSQESELHELTDSIYIAKNGFSNPYGILWTGFMGEQRICNLLPFDYKPDKK